MLSRVGSQGDKPANGRRVEISRSYLQGRNALHMKALRLGLAGRSSPEAAKRCAKRRA